MRLTLPSAFILGFGLVLSALILASGVSAQAEPADIQFPVAELGNCKDKEACKAYCDEPDNISACITFAEKNGLMPTEEIEIAKKFIKAGAKGPGGCRGKDSCEAYCDDISHIDACVAFAEQTGILPPDELQEAKKVQSAIAKGVKPPACRNKKECDSYCEAPEHMKECIAFGEAAGFLEGDELQEARKVLTAIEGGLTPPPCRGRDACESYCTNPEHMESCMEFALAAGLMTGEEEQESRKVLEVIKKGIKPPACRGKEECDSYCAEPGHTDECIQFAVAAGFMSEKEAEMAKRTGGKGPGGCVGKDACEAFCGNPENQDACINFAKENGMISEEEIKRMEESRGQFQGPPGGMPEEVESCLKTLLGDDGFEKMKSGQGLPSQEVGEKMSACFSQMDPSAGERPGPRQAPPDVGDDSRRMMPPQGGEGSQDWNGSDAQSLYEAEKSRIYEMERQRIYEAEKSRIMQEGGYPGTPNPSEFSPGAYPVPSSYPADTPRPEGVPMPGTYPSQTPPPGYQPSDRPDTTVPNTTTFETPPPPTTVELAPPLPPTEPSAPTSSAEPIPPTAPQSVLEIIVDNSLAAIGAALKKLGF